MTLIEQISKFTHDKTGLSLCLNYEQDRGDFVEGNFDIVLNGVKEGWFEVQYYEADNTLYISHIYLGSEFSKNNFTKDLNDWGVELLKENSIDYLSADAFYAAEHVVKDKGWTDNNINSIGKYIYEVKNG